ncbi:right-handed parallel beta-helix repeat-containing protein [bacterium]|nr:right-handed parallel beta-helix repeat-containing protein [bacterium]
MSGGRRRAMVGRVGLALAIVGLVMGPGTGWAASAVFTGDPVDPGSGQPYEILPGKPLVRPGADGILGTADDVVDRGVIGDIDLVVRAGDRPASADIPPPALATGDLPSGVAGPRGAGGVDIPFTVFVSDGAVAAPRPAGRLLAAADLDGLPVVVAAFADFDGDGVIGLTSADAAGDADAHLELRELEPVGRAAAILGGGVARGRIAIRAGLPASAGGLRVALAAVALTGSLDPSFFDGAIPNGPGISTALPFLPLRDLGRIIRDRAVPAGPTTTLQQLVQFAAVPPSDAYALPLDGSEPTIDGARVVSQPAVRVSVRRGRDPAAPPLDRLTFGTTAASATLDVRLLPVDRFENPADPPDGYRVVVDGGPALAVLGQRGQRAGRPLLIAGANGRALLGRVARGTRDGATGVLRIERDGVVVASLPYAVDARVQRWRPDVTVPSRSAPTLQAALDAATDRNHDGTIAISVRPGLYRGSVRVARALELTGAGSGLTVLLGGGSAPTVDVSAAGAVVQGVTAVGGGSGFRLGGRGAQLRASSAWRNLGAGIDAAGAGVAAREIAALENGGSGILIGGGADGARCEASLLRGNFGAGADVEAAVDAQLDGNAAIDNNAGGLVLNGAAAPTARDNQCVNNVGSGLMLARSGAATVAGNLSAGNDEDGLHMDRCDDATITGNTIVDNKGTGIFFRRGSNGDFAAAPGVQAAPGDNAVSGNRRGDVEIRAN